MNLEDCELVYLVEISGPTNYNIQSMYEMYDVQIPTFASSVTMSSALEVEFVLRSLIPLSDPRVTLILEITENSFQKHFCDTDLFPSLTAPSPRLWIVLRACLRVSPHSSCYYNDFVIIKCPHPGSCRDASCLIFFSQQSSVKQFTRLFIVYNTQTINGLCMHNELKRSNAQMRSGRCILKSCTIILSLSS